MKVSVATSLVLGLLAACGQQIGNPLNSAEQGSAAGMAQADPESMSTMLQITKAGQDCGLAQINVGKDVATGRYSIEWNPLEEGVDGKLRCLDERMRAQGINGGPWAKGSER